MSLGRTDIVPIAGAVCPAWLAKHGLSEGLTSSCPKNLSGTFLPKFKRKLKSPYSGAKEESGFVAFCRWLTGSVA